MDECVHVQVRLELMNYWQLGTMQVICVSVLLWRLESAGAACVHSSRTKHVLAVFCTHQGCS